MQAQVESEWEGWNGDTIIRLTDGSIWKQEEYHYEYRYAYRPKVILQGSRNVCRGNDPRNPC